MSNSRKSSLELACNTDVLREKLGMVCVALVDVLLSGVLFFGRGGSRGQVLVVLLHHGAAVGTSLLCFCVFFVCVV